MFFDEYKDSEGMYDCYPENRPSAYQKAIEYILDAPIEARSGRLADLCDELMDDRNEEIRAEDFVEMTKQCDNIDDNIYLSNDNRLRIDGFILNLVEGAHFNYNIQLPDNYFSSRYIDTGNFLWMECANIYSTVPAAQGANEAHSSEREAPSYSIFPADKQGNILMLLTRLEKDGWITMNGNGYRWSEGTSNALIAYWVYNVSHYLQLGNKVINGKKTTDWSRFEQLFGIEKGKLKVAYQHGTTYGQDFKPKGWEEIEPYTHS